MGNFNWNRESGDAESSGPDSGFAQLGFDAAPVPNGDKTVALTRRELREREQQGAQQPIAPPRAVQPQAVQPQATRRQDRSHHPRDQKKPRPPKSVRPRRPRRRNEPAGTRPAAVRPPARPPGQKAGGRKPARQRSLKRRMLSKLMTIGAMLGVGLMMVSTSLPANAFFAGEPTSGSSAVREIAEVQSLTLQTTATQGLARDGYTAVSLAEQIFLKYGNRSFSFTNNPNGTIQWPFAMGVPISSGFGERVAPCGGCSSYHMGVDFTPGIGTAIQAVADGVVSSVTTNTWGLGHSVVIDHQINGQLVQTVYAHMIAGSIRVVLGQEVKVADQVGQVGSTGISTGAHLHLEINVNGVPVDPFAWLKANAN